MILKNIHYIISFLLVLLSVLLTILVPGGPIETRDFSNYSETVLVLFNIFLTTLGLLSFVVAFLVAKRKKYSIVLSALFALLYILVYLFDLFKIFPTSPVSMSSTLFLIEVISTFIGFILIYLCVKYNNLEAKNNKNITIKFSFYKIVSILIVLLFAIGIVIFATKSAMGQ
ncbi:hypothetical protein CRV08_12930 [Halarcobacter ebronensis]|uniref:DUF8051 domain-containing protein n=1 Tax=Halarcobacter ebronensis TaxID=1462615 RepID=A0A4Q0Y834_9BACT|nr:hypothetical protein [Halarcobacter ebronensis]RXJ66380.1 hypothetical protein CRV08_12930 [Halarcobacter ebronensis]